MKRRIELKEIKIRKTLLPCVMIAQWKDDRLSFNIAKVCHLQYNEMTTSAPSCCHRCRCWRHCALPCRCRCRCGHRLHCCVEWRKSCRVQWVCLCSRICWQCCCIRRRRIRWMGTTVSTDVTIVGTWVCVLTRRTSTVHIRVRIVGWTIHGRTSRRTRRTRRRREWQRI